LGASHRRISQDDNRSLALLMPTEAVQLDYAPIEGLLVQAGFGSAPHEAWAGTSKSVLLQNLGPKTYWHFATHGAFNWDDPRESGVLIGSDNTMLTLGDLLESRQRVGSPRLVVLSACSTGLSDVKHNPDEFTGLPTGFLFAGAAGVVASLWPVNDLSTTLLMSKFYDLHLGLHQRPAQALRGAQLWLKNATIPDLQFYVRTKRAAEVLSVEQFGLFTEDLSYVGKSGDPDFRPFASPQYWGAFVVYGE
jgi:CHAT domain-containing protein